MNFNKKIKLNTKRTRKGVDNIKEWSYNESNQ